ncbi:hypothetical protein RND81_13G162400 [Saponaria officinalis]|uniref:KIB1-4 beta-propeller domain-containing protein n=1 Tax=Saponaria officinalis TaxID=3572 RepID=A0AAW1H198_SAPOF
MAPFSPCPVHPNLSPPLPIIMPMPPGSGDSRYSLNRCILSVIVIYFLRLTVDDHPMFPPSAWLFFINQPDRRKLRLQKPFLIPNFHKPYRFPRTLNLLDSHATELGHFYNLTGPGGDSTINGIHFVMAILSSNMSAVFTVSYDGKLGFVRVRVGERWEIIHGGKILGIDRRARIGLVKPFTLNPIVPPISGGGGRRKQLVESLGKLFLVVRCNRFKKKSEKSVAFKVYKLSLDVKKKKWNEVIEFGDRIFLFGNLFSLSISTRQLGGVCKKNCILYENMSFSVYGGNDDDYDTFFRGLGLYDLYVGVWHLEDAAHIGSIGSYPCYFELLWPPPSWNFPMYK